MTAALESRAELLKLGRTLGADPDDLAFLAQAAPQDLRALREDVADLLFASDRVHFERVAALSGKIPRGLAAQLAQRALGPRLAARAAGLLEPEIATDLARRLPTPFLADIATHADPRRLVNLLGHLPPQRIAEVTAELRRRGEWLSMGGFVGHLDEAALDAALTALDGEALLRTGFVMDHKERVEHVLAVLDDQRVRELLEAAAREGLWVEAFELSLHASEAQRARLAQALDALGDDELQTMVAAIRDDAALAAAAEPLAGLAPPRVRALLA